MGSKRAGHDSATEQQVYIYDFGDGSAVKNPPANAGDIPSIPGLGRSPGEGHGNPLQYSCLENPHGQRSLAGFYPWDLKDSDTIERLSTHRHIRVQSGLYGKCVFDFLRQFCCSFTQSCLTLCDPTDCSTPGFPVLHHLAELAQTHVH